MTYKSQTADIIYDQMLRTTANEVSLAAIRIMDAIQGDKVSNQMLGLAAAFIVMLHHYGMSHTDAMGIADNIVYSGENNNMKPEFKAIKNYLKEEWEL